VHETLLAPHALQRGYFNPAFVRQCVDNLYQGDGRRVPLVWQLLNIELWHRAFVDV
jgi:hypothetical protein